MSSLVWQLVRTPANKVSYSFSRRRHGDAIPNEATSTSQFDIPCSIFDIPSSFTFTRPRRHNVIPYSLHHSERSRDMRPSSNGVLKFFFIAAFKMLCEKLFGSGRKLQTILRLGKSVPFIFKEYVFVLEPFFLHRFYNLL